MRHSSLCVVNNRRAASIGGGGQDADNNEKRGIQDEFWTGIGAGKTGKRHEITAVERGCCYQSTVSGRTQQDDGSLSVCGEPVRARTVERDHD